MRRAWETASLGDGGSICLKLYVRAEPDGQAPEHLVCVTPPAEGDALVGRVLRTRANGRPRTVADVVVSAPHDADRLPLVRPRRDPAARRGWSSPASRCGTARAARAPTGCADLAPDPPAAREFRLRRDTASG